MGSKVTSKDFVLAKLADVFFDSPAKEEMMALHLVLQAFEGISSFESTTSYYLSAFPSLIHCKTFKAVQILVTDLSNGNAHSYFAFMTRHSLYWASLLSFKNYIYRVRVLQYKVLLNASFKSSLNRCPTAQCVFDASSLFRRRKRPRYFHQILR